MSAPYTPPKFKQKAFNCPICNAYSHQSWHQANYDMTRGYVPVEDLYVADCENCGVFSIWLKDRMVFPDRGSNEPPNTDLRDDIKDDYNEAISILSRSPRGAAALLRLCIQKLCQQLGLPGKDLDADIGTLVKSGLPVRIQKALDIVRVIGNYAVHPGVLDITDDIETASKLFELVNHIAYSMISQPKEIEGMFDT